MNSYAGICDECVTSHDWWTFTMLSILPRSCVFCGKETRTFTQNSERLQAAASEYKASNVSALKAEIERLTKALAEANAKLGNLSDAFRRLPPITQELAEDYAAFGAVASKIMNDGIDAAINDEVDSIDKELGQ